MGELHVVTQVEPVYCAGAVLFVLRGAEEEVKRAVRSFAVAVYVDDVEIHVRTVGCNLGDGDYVERRSVVVVQSGSKYREGVEQLVELMATIAPHLEDAAWFVHVAGFPELAFLSFRVSGGRLITEPVEHPSSVETPEAYMWKTTRSPMWLHRAALRRSQGVCELCRDVWANATTTLQEPPLAGHEVDLCDVVVLCDRCDARVKLSLIHISEPTRPY